VQILNVQMCGFKLKETKALGVDLTTKGTKIFRKGTQSLNEARFYSGLPAKLQPKPIKAKGLGVT
jgi:hypothetical protein